MRLKAYDHRTRVVRPGPPAQCTARRHGLPYDRNQKEAMAEEDKPQQPHTQAQIEQEAIRRMQAVLAGAGPLMPTLPLVAPPALWSRCGGWRLGAWLLEAPLAPGLRYLL